MKMKTHIRLLFSRFEWSFPEKATKPVKVERALPHMEVGDVVFEDRKKWRIARVDEHGVWAIPA